MSGDKVKEEHIVSIQKCISTAKKLWRRLCNNVSPKPCAI
jgi:hypothetical protein